MLVLTLTITVVCDEVGVKQTTSTSSETMESHHLTKQLQLGDIKKSDEITHFTVTGDSSDVMTTINEEPVTSATFDRLRLLSNSIVDVVSNTNKNKFTNINSILTPNSTAISKATAVQQVTDGISKVRSSPSLRAVNIIANLFIINITDRHTSPRLTLAVNYSHVIYVNRLPSVSLRTDVTDFKKQNLEKTDFNHKFQDASFAMSGSIRSPAEISSTNHLTLINTSSYSDNGLDISYKMTGLSHEHHPVTKEGTALTTRRIPPCPRELIRGRSKPQAIRVKKYVTPSSFPATLMYNSTSSTAVTLSVWTRHASRGLKTTKAPDLSLSTRWTRSTSPRDYDRRELMSTTTTTSGFIKTVTSTEGDNLFGINQLQDRYLSKHYTVNKFNSVIFLTSSTLVKLTPTLNLKSI